MASNQRRSTAIGLDTKAGFQVVRIEDDPPVSQRLKPLLAAMPLVMFALLVGLFVLPDGGPAAFQPADAAAPGDQILVKFKPGTPQQAIDALNQSHGAQHVGSIAAIDVRVVRVPAGQGAAAVATAFARNPAVQFAEVDSVQRIIDLVPNDPQFNLNQWALQKIKGPTAWSITTGSFATVIAILDTGVWAEHPDLAGKVNPGFNFVGGNTNAADDHGHGTGVAGVAAASSNNLIGMAGVSWGSPVLPVKVCDSAGSCLTSNVINGITWATDRGAKVINLSLGGPGACGSSYQAAVDYAWSRGVVVVAASGNEGGPVYSPANCNNVISVGATDSTDTRTSWSGYGAGLDLVAPGATILCPSLSGGYAAGTGTSFASPLVAGAAALLRSQGASNAATVSALTAGADDLGATAWDQFYGWGRLNAHQALLALGGAAPTPTSIASPVPTATATPPPTQTATPPATSNPPPTATPSPSPPLGDVTAPLVSLLHPSNGQTVKGNVTLSANASDNVGVTKVVFYVDGALLKTDTSAPYSTNWSTRKLTNGLHAVSARAFDAAGNVAEVVHTVDVRN